MIALIVSLWALCGLIGAGIIIADIDDGILSYRETCGTAVVMILLLLVVGPTGLILVYCLTGFAQKGFRLWPRRHHP